MFENSFSKVNSSHFSACFGMPCFRAHNLIITDTVILAASVFVVSVLLLIALTVGEVGLIISLLASLFIILSLLPVLLITIKALNKQSTRLIHPRT